MLSGDAGECLEQAYPGGGESESQKSMRAWIQPLLELATPLHFPDTETKDIPLFLKLVWILQPTGSCTIQDLIIS